MAKTLEYSTLTIEMYDDNPRRAREAQLYYLASDVMQTLNIQDPDEMGASITRAMRACDMLHIPVFLHFRREFSYDGLELTEDWRLSSLACYLIIINSDPRHESVAKAQLYFAANNIR